MMTPPHSSIKTDTAPTVIENVRIVDPSRNIDEVGTIVAVDGLIVGAGASARNQGYPAWSHIIDGTGKIATPGLVDMQVFTGEPGAEHRETLASASKAAASGGVTTMIVMPDTDPIIDDPALVDFILRRARDTAFVNVHPMAALTKGLAGQEISELGLLKEAGAVAFTNGRHPIRNAQTMRRLLAYARDFDCLIAHQPIDPDLVGSGVMNEGETASRLGLMGIPREAEIIMLERDLRLAALSSGKYHASQISCGASASAVKRAKAEGLKMSAGVSINHLTLNEIDIGAYRTFFKLAPPLRSEDDRVAMIEAVADGTVDVIVSGHDPQDVETKRHPFADAADGAIGMETLLAAALRLWHNEMVPLPRLIDAMSTRPAQLLGLPCGTLKPGAEADILLFDPNLPWIVKEETIVSRSKNSPFEGARFQGQVMETFVAGQSVFRYSKG